MKSIVLPSHNPSQIIAIGGHKIEIDFFFPHMGLQLTHQHLLKDHPFYLNCEVGLILDPLQFSLSLQPCKF